MAFEQDKKNILGKKDKSFIGGIDKPIEKLVNLINSKAGYYTTSSCSGRAILIKARDKKEENLFVWISHKKINFSSFKNVLKKVAEGNKDELIYFKIEPCFVVVISRNLEKASALLNKAREKAGWRKSGIMTIKKKIALELMSSEKLELPIANRGKLLVDDDFLKLLVKESNKKLEKSREKIKRFEEMIK